ncbi:MAG: class IV adenylate cyclase [Desulfurococcales archaeon]|nr:class IV adenylate cyclase [Desulfurococcales archaeon]
MFFDDDEEEEKILEAEGKVRIGCSRIEELKRELENKGFKSEGLAREADTYYKHPCYSLDSMDVALRVRIVNDNYKILTLKGPRKKDAELKVREEIEVNVIGDIETLLRKLGFKPIFTIEKERYYLKARGLRITLDKVKKLGCFMEIELKGASWEEAKKLLDELRIPWARIITETYAEMMRNKMLEEEEFLE